MAHKSLLQVAPFRRGPFFRGAWTFYQACRQPPTHEMARAEALERGLAIQMAHQGPRPLHPESSPEGGNQGKTGVIVTQQSERTGCGFFLTP
jgi:hypothetical protein